MKNKFTSECPLVLDGAMGTELLRMGVELPLPLGLQFPMKHVQIRSIIFTGNI